MRLRLTATTHSWDSASARLPRRVYLYSIVGGNCPHVSNVQAGTRWYVVQFRLAPLAAREALAISNWHYKAPYDFYDWQRDPDDLAEFLDPQSWPGRYYAVVDEQDRLVGFFQCEPAPDAVEIGLGLHPALTGRGLGAAFLQAGLDFAKRQCAPQRFTLRVATFNRRAIRVYERIGFRPGRIFMHATNGGLHEFMEMTRPA